MSKKIRNENYLPFIEDEGVYIKPLPSPPNADKGKIWNEGLNANERVFYHQTLSSARKSARFRNYW